jgi:hypothetical protein
MPLEGVQAAFENDLAESIRAYEELATTKTFTRASDFTHEDICMLEGILSHTWQDWCRFCRVLIMESCRGTVDMSENQLPQLPGALSEHHVSGAAARIKQRRTPIWGFQNTILRFEPTWGDVDVLTDIITGMAPANSATLLGMCTLASPSSKILQGTRNAAAHHNHQTVSDLLRMSGVYTTFPITHPCQALLWVENSSGMYMFPGAIEGLVTASIHAVI